jgi:DsbC/DsbD-like thiol-disulfide interchange protein
LDPPPGIRLLKVTYPQPQRLQVKGESDPWLVFSDQSLLGLELQIDPALTPGQYQLRGQLSYQACDEHICQMPEVQEAAFILQVLENTHVR